MKQVSDFDRFRAMTVYELKKLWLTPAPYILLSVMIAISLLIPATFNRPKWAITPPGAADPENRPGLTSLEDQPGPLEEYRNYLRTAPVGAMEGEQLKSAILSAATDNDANLPDGAVDDTFSGAAYFNYFAGNLSGLILPVFALIIVSSGNPARQSHSRRLAGWDRSLLAAFTAEVITILAVSLLPVIGFTLCYSLNYGPGPLHMKFVFNLRRIGESPWPATLPSAWQTTGLSALPLPTDLLDNFRGGPPISLFQGIWFMAAYQVGQILSITAWIRWLKTLVKTDGFIALFTLGALIAADCLSQISILKVLLGYVFLSYSNSFRDVLPQPDPLAWITGGHSDLPAYDYYTGIIVMVFSTILLLYLAMRQNSDFPREEVNQL